MKEFKTEQKKKFGKTVKTYLSLGSNFGDRHGNLLNAINEIKKSDALEVTNISSFYSTEPINMKSDNRFLNCALEIETTLEPLDLLDLTEEIELLYGRKDKSKKMERTIDIDIILYGGLIVSFPRLKIPHPRMAERRFVLEPLSQIAPALIHPTLKKTSMEMSAEVSNQVVFLEKNEETEI